MIKSVDRLYMVTIVSVQPLSMLQADVVAGPPKRAQSHCTKPAGTYGHRAGMPRGRT